MHINDGNIAFAYNPEQKKIYMIIFTGENGPVKDTILFDETRWEKIIDSVRKANFQAEHSGWGKCATVLKAEETLLEIQKELDRSNGDKEM